MRKHYKSLYTFKPFFNVLIMCLLAFGYASCRQEGCKDINAVNYDDNADINDGLCTYRYLNDVTLVRVSFNRLPGSLWDTPNIDPLTYPFEEYPDLKFYLKRKNSNFWEIQTDITFDATNTPINWNIRDFGSNYLKLRTDYEYKLVDEDETGQEVIMEGTFVPANVLQDNKIILQDASTIIELNYIIS
jgi:hypothetical protein